MYRTGNNTFKVPASAIQWTWLLLPRHNIDDEPHKTECERFGHDYRWVGRDTARRIELRMCKRCDKELIARI